MTVKTQKPIGWRAWYTIVIIALVIVTGLDEPATIPYLFVWHWAIWFVPVWGIVSLVKFIRRKSVPSPASTEPLS